MEIWISSDQDQMEISQAQTDLVHKVIRTVMSLEGQELGDQVEIGVTFVDDEAIKALNREHRGIDRPTDVLSFSQLEGEDMGALPEGEALPLGDIVISVERCVEQAADYGHSFERELGFLTAHGMLHLLGYDHQTPEEEATMMAKTEEILGGLGLTR